MQRRHVSAPPWLWERITALAEADGRTTAELLRRLMVNYLRAEDASGLPLPNAQRLRSYKRASASEHSSSRAGKRRRK
jgi:hypothetical protein